MKSSLHIAGDLGPPSGETGASVTGFVHAISETCGYRQQLLYLAKPGSAAVEAPGVELLRFNWLPSGAWLGRLEGARSLAQAIGRAAVVHIHGLWKSPCAAAALVCRNLNRPFLISAHGELERRALRHQRWRKAAYSTLAERRNLSGAACLCASTAQEIADYRRYGPRAPVALIPNGIGFPPAPDPEPFYRQFPDLAGKRLVLFMGRVHYKMGIDILCRAWATVANEFPGAQLAIAGPDVEGTRNRIEALVRKLRLEDRVTFTGMLNGPERWAALAAAEVFALPSHSEGSGSAVLEALAMARPVIITPACNVPEVAHTGCGAVVVPSDRQVEDALRDMLRRSSEERAAMGARGAELVRARFSWPAIGRLVGGLYDWVLGCGPMPDTVCLAAVGKLRDVRL